MVEKRANAVTMTPLSTPNALSTTPLASASRDSATLGDALRVRRYSPLMYLLTVAIFACWTVGCGGDKNSSASAVKKTEAAQTKKANAPGPPAARPEPPPVKPRAPADLTPAKPTKISPTAPVDVGVVPAEYED